MPDTPKANREVARIRARIGDTWRDGETFDDVRDPYRGDVVAHAPVSSDAGPATTHSGRRVRREGRDGRDARLRARCAAAPRGRQHRRAEPRRSAVSMALESGKALKDAVFEVARSADTLRLCAEEAVRIQGEHIPMDASAIGAGKIAMLMRFPVGVVAAITPFNGPVNLAAHKVGPALAAGNSLVLKASPKAPLCVHQFIEAIIDAGPAAGRGQHRLRRCHRAADWSADRRVDFVSFTGSIRVGKIIRNAIGMKRVALELGGVGPTFVHHDADLAAAAKACARNAMALAGQSCVSVQNVYVHRRVADVFTEALLREADQIRFGDPLDMTTEVGTLIDEQAAIRVEGIVGRAVDAGALLLRGGHRTGAQLDATILGNVTPEMDAVCDEIFGPAMTVQAYDDLAPIFKSISDSPYGLQAGIYTNSLDLALSAIRTLRTGGVIVNGTSRWRSDQMPYGGVKDSGIGREGPKFAIRDMTEERFFVFN